MTPHTKCEAYVRNGNGCTRNATTVIWHPEAPPASENATINVCAQHANSYSLAGWKPWPA